MAAKQSILLIAGISAGIGISFLITSSIVLNEFREGLEVFCNNNNDKGLSIPGFDVDLPIGGTTYCKTIQFWVAASALGIIAGALQICSFGMALINKTGLWCGFSILICVISITCFVLAAIKEAFNGHAPGKIIAFAIISIMDAIFSIVAPICVWAQQSD